MTTAPANVARDITSVTVISVSGFCTACRYRSRLLAFSAMGILR